MWRYRTDDESQEEKIMSDYRTIKVNKEKLEQMGYGRSFSVCINDQYFQNISFNDVDFITPDWTIYFNGLIVMSNIIDEHMKFIICGSTKKFKSLEEMFIHLEEVGCIEFEL